MSRRNLIQTSLEQAANPSLDRHELFGESLEVAAELSMEAQYFQQLSDVADGLDDMRLAMEDIQEASPQHLLLVEAGLNLALAGTPLRAEQTYPGLESQIGQTLSTEKMSEAIRIVLETIRRIVKWVGEKLAAFYEAILGDVGIVRTRLMFVRAKVAEIEGSQPKTRTVNLGNAAYGVATEWGIPPDSRVLVRSLTELLRQTHVIRSVYVPSVIKTGNQLLPVMQHWQDALTDGEGWLQRANEAAATHQMTDFMNPMGRLGGVADTRFPMGSAQAAPPLPGGRSLVFVEGDKIYPDKSNGSALDRAMVLQSNSISLVRMFVNRDIHGKSMEMETMSVSSLHEVLDLVDQILDEIDQGVKSQVRQQLLDAGKRMERTLDGVSTAQEQELAHLRRGLRYAGVYSQWAYSPYVQLLAHALTVSRSTLTVCSRHISAH